MRLYRDFHTPVEGCERRRRFFHRNHLNAAVIFCADISRLTGGPRLVLGGVWRPSSYRHQQQRDLCRVDSRRTRLQRRRGTSQAQLLTSRFSQDFSATPVRLVRDTPGLPGAASVCGLRPRVFSALPSAGARIPCCPESYEYGRTSCLSTPSQLAKHSFRPLEQKENMESSSWHRERRQK